MSKNFVPSPYDSCPGPKIPGFSQDFLPSIPNTSPRPPEFFVASDLRHVLNYSIQTGEEFALEFMQDRINTRKPLVPVMSEESSTSTSNIDWRKQAGISEENSQRKLLGYPSFGDTSSQEPSKRLPPESYDFEPTKVKFICNFGGRFLPRPSDSALRYVGGERHLIEVNQGMSWQELIRKTTKLIRRAHTIKYNLPGEKTNMLISVACDDDLNHMIDECIIIEESEKKPAMYLFSDDDDEHHMHFVIGSPSGAETEAQFIALVNGLLGPGETLNTPSLGSTSANDMQQLMFDINEELLAGRTEEASTYTKSKLSHGIITVPSKTFRGQLETMPSGFQTQMNYKDYRVQNDDSDVSSYSARKTRDVHLGSPVLSEVMYSAKREQGGGQAVSRQQPEPQRTAMNMTKKIQQATGAQERESSRRELLIPLDNSSPKIPSPISNYSIPVSRTSCVDELSRAQSEPLIQFTQSDNSSGLQQLMIQEPVDGCLYEMPASVLRDSQKKVHQHKSSNDNMMKPRRYSSQEDMIPYAEMNQLSNRNVQLPNRIEMVDPSYASRPNESNARMLWHDDMNISIDPQSQEQIFAIKSRQKQQPTIHDVMCSIAMKKDHPSKPASNNDETVSSSPFTSSDKATELQPNSPMHALLEKQKESPSSRKQDEHSSKTTQCQSFGLDCNSPQVRNRSQEAKEKATPLISKLEVHETKNDEPVISSNAALQKDDISNVQIISNNDLEDLREMGSGAFGTVFHGKWRGTDVAIKRIKNSCFTYASSETNKVIVEFWREAAIISKLHHPNVLAFYGIVNDGPGGTLATVTEFMVSGSLKKVLLRKEKILDWRKRIMLAMHAAFGMEYLHSKDVVHFDLKCDNLLVNLKDPSRPICKVADFGLSKIKQTTMVSGGMRGTLPWMAPELLTMSRSKVYEKVDVYSFGIVMWEILTGEEPYDGMHYGEVIGGILSNTLRPPVPNSCDPEWRKLMEQCWSTEPEQRPSFTEVATHLRAMLEASQSQSSQSFA